MPHPRYEALERAQNEGTSDDPYLPFVLGTFYAQQLTAAIDEKAEAELNGDDITAIDARIDEYEASALAAFQLAQEAFSDDTGIQSRIDGIKTLVGDVEEETP
ncbi:hypothetical protein ACFLSW_04795 [Candidatus Bipolaricaulota bacterium]